MSDPAATIGALQPGESLDLMTGLRLTRNPRNLFVLARVHYTVDPTRRSPAWAKASAAKYGGLGSHRWRREMEIDFAAASGIPIFANFDRAVHAIEPFPIPRHWPRWLMYDVGGHNPHALDWWTLDPETPGWPMYLYRQWYQGLIMPDRSPGGYFLVDDVIRIAYELSIDEEGRMERLDALVVDPQSRASQAVQRENAADEETPRSAAVYERITEMLDQLAWGIDLAPGNNLKDESIEDIIDRLGNYPLYQEDEDGKIVERNGEPVIRIDTATQLPLIVKPRLFVFKTCPWAAWELGRYRWKDWSDEMKLSRNHPETPVDKDDHSVTNLIRLMNWIRRDETVVKIGKAAEPTDPASRAVAKWRKEVSRQARDRVHEAQG